MKGEDLVGSPVMVIQKSVFVSILTGTKGMKKGENQSIKEKAFSQL